MPKFDVAIMNPPYDGSLHLKILESVIPVAEKVVNISPVRWLQDPLAKYKKNSDYNKFEESISKKIESLDVIDAKSANGLFGAIFGTDLGIYTCCNTTSNCINTDLTDSITKRVVQHMIQNHATFDYNKKDGVRIRIPSICGGKSGGSGERNKVRLCELRNCLGQPLVFTDGLLNGKQWHEYYRKNQYSKTTDGITCSIKFNSTTEADNFFASVNTQFYKYIHHNVVLDVHIEECKILFMQDYTQPWDDKRFCKHFNITGYIDDEHAEPNSEWEIILTTMKEYVLNMPKFDVAIMNPPYDKNLHLKILEAVIPIAEKVVNISPVRWLQDPLAKYKKNSDYKKFEDSISKKIKDLIIIPADKANDLFSLAAFGDLGIYVLCNNGGYDYTQILKLSLGVSHNICSKMLNKLSDTLKNHYTLGCQTDYNVKVTDICGSLMGFVVNKIHNRIYKNELEYKNNKVKKSDCHNVNKGESFISFNTSIEAENFLKSVYTKFHRYIVLSLQNDVHVPLFALPFMGDYTKPWDDKRFCEYFGITGYISDTEAEPNSEWEIILNTMKEYV